MKHFVFGIHEFMRYEGQSFPYRVLGSSRERQRDEEGEKIFNSDKL